MPLSCRIPKRLWETGVQPMLERLLHALPISSTSAHSADVSESTQAVQVALLEHLTDQGDDLRVLHHFFKSLSSSHSHLASRESLLPLFDRVHQQRRVQPDASPISLFIHLHGILFTRVQLDDFDDVFDRFREALHAQALDGVRALPNREPTPHEIPNYAWMMMGTINLAALLQYGAEDALLAPNDSHPANQKAEQREILGNVATGPAASQEASGSSPGLHTLRLPQAASVNDAQDQDVPVTLRHAIRLAFTVLDIVAACSIADRAPGQIVPPNPYLSIMLTFLATAIKQPETLGIIERHIPWDRLVLLSKSATPIIDPRRDIASKVAGDAPLPEDWCLRGMSWVGRRVYERGFWKSQGVHSALVFESEVDVLARSSLGAQEEAILGLDEGPDDEDAPARRNEHPGASGRKLGLRALRWRRISWTLTVLAKTVPGLDYEPALEGGRGGIVIVDPLRTKQQRWRTEDAEAQIQTHTARLGLGEVEPLEAEEGDEVDDDSPASELEEDVEQATDSAEIIQLKNKKQVAAGKSLMPAVPLLPGYSILVLDTNIALTQGDVLEQLIDSMQWTLIIPLAVITELDGIKKNQNAVGQEATRALSLIEARLRTHAKFVKVQTSRGNYLPDLRFRNEDIDFSGIGKRTDDDKDDGTFARSLDEIILRAVAWQDAHFVDRRTLLGSPESTKAVAQGTAKVALVTFDRNLRLKARIRGSHSIGRAELLAILAPEKG
ncbi:Nonsense-mediated mRNA decay protein [Ceraceosorus bombacis]|uniref:Nonsense-mediated mRNA decay protein n=1 Tax=Ceraceosorus bombacis TaxID=401625 RepID=A0A0P1BN44_9BASI|nr:Nonsense-mediated mRNA decay protein [Ceraceosorus bombacis]